MFKTPRKVQGSGKSSGRSSGGSRAKLPKPVAAPLKEEAMEEVNFVQVKQELVEVKAEAFDLSGVSVGEAVGDGFIKCNQCDYSTSHLETLKKHTISLHSKEVEMVRNTQDSSSDLSSTQLSGPTDFDLGKRKRKVPARFLSPPSPRAPPSKIKSPPSSSSFTAPKSSTGSSKSPGKPPTPKRKSPSSAKPRSPHPSGKAKLVHIASPKPVNSPSFIPTNNLQPPPSLLQKPPLHVENASINSNSPSMPLTPRLNSTFSARIFMYHMFQIFQRIQRPSSGTPASQIGT